MGASSGGGSQGRKEKVSSAAASFMLLPASARTERVSPNFLFSDLGFGRIQQYFQGGDLFGLIRFAVER
jgi:hypothetical protein